VAADWFILLPDGEREGPYREGELLDFLSSGELTPDTPCLYVPDNRVATAGEWFQVLDEDGSGATAGESRDGPAGDPPPRTAKQAWKPAPFPEEKPEAPRRPLPDRVVYRGHPSLLTYWRTGLFAFVLGAGGMLLSTEKQELSAIGLMAALVVLLWGALHRLGQCYLVTTRRVELITGLVARSSRELRHEDIRSLRVDQQGLAGLAGIGTITFSATGGHEEDVIFTDVRGPTRIKDLVRKIQERITGAA
jgi:hypothetical protein